MYLLNMYMLRGEYVLYMWCNDMCVYSPYMCECSPKLKTTHSQLDKAILLLNIDLTL